MMFRQSRAPSRQTVKLWKCRPDGQPVENEKLFSTGCPQDLGNSAKSRQVSHSSTFSRDPSWVMGRVLVYAVDVLGFGS